MIFPTKLLIKKTPLEILRMIVGNLEESHGKSMGKLWGIMREVVGKLLNSHRKFYRKSHAMGNPWEYLWKNSWEI